MADGADLQLHAVLDDSLSKACRALHELVEQLYTSNCIPAALGHVQEHTGNCHWRGRLCSLSPTACHGQSWLCCSSAHPPANAHRWMILHQPGQPKHGLHGWSKPSPRPAYRQVLCLPCAVCLMYGISTATTCKAEQAGSSAGLCCLVPGSTSMHLQRQHGSRANASVQSNVQK